MLKRASIIPLLCAIVALGGCTVHQTTAPSIGGTSEFAWSVGLSAAPDSINQDGASRSAISVRVFGPTGNAAPNVTLRLDTMVNGTQVDFGTLSARTVVTGADGTATVTYTAPPAPPAGTTLGTCRTFNTVGALAGQCVSIVATPIGSADQTFPNNFATSQSQSVEIRLMPTGLIVPPTAPVAAFTVAPTPVALNVPASFDASSSCPVPLNGASCAPSGVDASTTITAYTWSFGDGGTGNGRVASHTYTSVGTFTATLTVTNSAGVSSAPTTQQISVGSLTAPSGDFTVSPSAPAVNDSVFFSADGITAAPGHQIVQFSWNFGDGSSATGLTAQHQYTAAATYSVILSVADDSGQKKTFTKTVAVGTGSPSASFTFAVTNPATHQVTVDGSGSSAAGNATISTYAWTWGDGASTAASSASVASHPYGAAGTYTVTLTVKDSLGRSGSSSQSVTVP